MAITFPNSPSSGDTHTTSNGLQYTYDGEKWTTIGTNSAGTWTRSGTTVSLTTAGDDLNVDSGTLFVDASTNNVGVGTSSPGTYGNFADDLVVYNASQPGITLATGTSGYGSIYFADGTVGNALSRGQIQYNHNDDSLLFASAATERLRIDSSGRLLVGTTNAVAFGSRQVLAVANGTTGGVISLYNSTTATANTRISSNPTGSEINDIGIHAASTNGSIIAYTNNDTERMRIDSSGRVGIGVSSLIEKLEVDGNIVLGPANAVKGASSTGTLQIQGGATNPGGNILFGGGSGTDDIRFRTTGASTSSTERMRIDSSGRLLVGASSGSGNAKLQVQGGTQFGDAYIDLCFNGNIASGQTLGELRFTDAASSANVYANIACQADAAPGSGDYPGRLVFRTTADSASSPTERMRISSGGSVSIGSSSTSAKLSVTSDGSTLASLILFESAAGSGSVNTAAFYRNSTSSFVGSIATTGTATAYNTSSDYRLKENVVDIADGITRVKQLQPKRFNFIADADTTVDGFLAHEAQTVVPEAVTGEKDGEAMQGIDQSKLVPLLTAALQEAIAKIETLEQRLSDAGIA